MTGCLLAVICYLPIYKAMQAAAENRRRGVDSTGGAHDHQRAASPWSLTDVDGERVFLGVDETTDDPNYPALIFLVFMQVCS